MGCFGRSIICPGRSKCLLRFVFRVVMGPMSYLRYLCLFVNSGVQHILCCVFVFLRLVYPSLSVSLDCPFLISHRFVRIIFGLIPRI